LLLDGFTRKRKNYSRITKLKKAEIDSEEIGCSFASQRRAERLVVVRRLVAPQKTHKTVVFVSQLTKRREKESTSSRQREANTPTSIPTHIAFDPTKAHLTSRRMQKRTRRKAPLAGGESLNK
jgi:hypothetical protein